MAHPLELIVIHTTCKMSVETGYEKNVITPTIIKILEKLFVT